ncbi:hypothetical protein A9Q76_03830, partial [Arcobacter sp. 31_11_sub10_T18]
MFKEFNLDNFEESKNLLEEKIEKSRAAINELIEIENKTYNNFARPYQEIAEELNEFITPIFHIDSVKNSEQTQKVHEECLPLISNYETELSQNESVYSALKDIQYNHSSEIKAIQEEYSLSTEEIGNMLDFMSNNDVDEGTSTDNFTVTSKYSFNDIQYNDKRLLNATQIKVVENENR